DYITVGCDYLGTQMVRLWVIDESGSFDFCDVLLVVQNNMGGCDSTTGGGNGSMIVGNIYTEDNRMIEQVDVLAQGEQLQASIATGADGFYQFNVPMGSIISVTPFKDINHMNGVSTMDLIYLQKHVVDMKTLESPYLRIAADVNNDNVINALDLLVLRALILNEIERLDQNTSWRFVKNDYEFTTDSPEAENFQESVDLNVDQQEMTIDFIGIKIGDLDLDGDPSRSAGRSAKGLVLHTTDQTLIPGMTYEVPIKVKDLVSLQGFQFTFQVDTDAAVIRDVRMDMPSFDAANFGWRSIETGFLPVSWNSNNAVGFADKTMFTLVLEAKAVHELSDIITINGQITPAAAYGENGFMGSVRLDLGDAIGESEHFALLQNRPNPFVDRTNIRFVLPESMPATITLHDVSGRLLKEITGDYKKGKNTIRISAEEIGISGLVYYKLQAGSYQHVRKMIVQ
ncbi:MAG: T9SS type A sorting domain-containing protein, partial [Saprospiraceae bacterium]|nr:T9SS type A sorting domain-containing protein [Saprospiraceae bacterium]